MATMEKSHFCTRRWAGVMISYLLRTCIFTGRTYHHAATLSLPAAFPHFVSNLIDFDDTLLWKADQRAEPLMRVMFAVGGWIPMEGLADGMVQLVRGRGHGWRCNISMLCGDFKCVWTQKSVIKWCNHVMLQLGRDIFFWNSFVKVCAPYT